MKAKVIVSFACYRVGDVFDPPAMLFDYYKGSGWIEAVREPEQTPQTPKRRPKKTKKA